MSMDIEKEKQRLAQGKFLKWVNRQILPTEMVTVYLTDKTDDHNIGVYCALTPNEHVERSLNDPTWDLHLGGGLPGAMEHELNKLIPASEHANVKGSIARLEKVLMVRGIQGHDEHMKFLRKLQPCGPVVQHTGKGPTIRRSQASLTSKVTHCGAYFRGS